MRAHELKVRNGVGAVSVTDTTVWTSGRYPNLSRESPGVKVAGMKSRSPDLALKRPSNCSSVC